MNEIRDRFDVAGIMIGRTLAMVDHKARLADLAMKVRRYEEHYRERCKRTAASVGAGRMDAHQPSGWLRGNSRVSLG